MPGSEKGERLDRLAILELFCRNIVTWLWVHIVAVVAITVLLRTLFHSWWIVAGGIALYLLLIGGWEFLVWRSLRIARTEQGITFSIGPLIHKQRTFSWSHLQGVMFSDGPLLKLLKRSNVSAETAGGMRQPELLALALPHKEAHAIVNSFVEATESSVQNNTRSVQTTTNYRLPLSHIIMNGLTQNSVVWAAVTIIVPLITALFKALKGIDFNWEHIIDQGFFVWFISLVGALIALAIALIGIAAKFLIDLGTKIVALYDYRLTRRGKLLHSRRGLIVTKLSFMQADRVQALGIKRPFLQRLVGWGAINLETAGFVNAATDGGSITTLAPIVKRRSMAGLIEQLMPEYASDIKVPRSDIRGLGRFTFGPSMTAGIALVLALFIDYIWPPIAQWATSTFGLKFGTHVWWWIPLLGYAVVVGSLVVLGLSVDLWCATGAAVEGDLLILRNGILGRNEIRVQRNKIQGLDIRQTVFQRNDHHAHLYCDIVSGPRGKRIAVRNLNEQDARAIQAWYESAS